MIEKWTDPGTFHVGINMAGAVSAGAYTAGVLDFLTEALEEWYTAKATPNALVPMHDISIDVFSGASAGGMCAAISAVMLQGAFEHIRNPADLTVKNTTNRFYESWVNRIDIEPLLGTSDLSDGSPVISLLDSTIIDQIADYAISPGTVARRPYVSDSLTLFLTLTNVRGVPFSLNGNAEGSAEEEIAYYADRLQFETVSGSSDPVFKMAKPLPIGSNAGAWPLLKDAAKATGAFPLFLAPRKIARNAGDYMNSPWQTVASEDSAVPPHWTLHADDSYPTLNVDGGVTDNDPFQLAHDYLAIHNPKAILNPRTGDLENPRPANEANCAVLTVAPFPANALYDPKYDFDSNSSLFGMLPNLFTALVSQARFFGESLSAVMSGASASRFVLAPSDFDNPNDNALQCAVLGAFGGFFERGFRAHDYQLGRRNCQKFLMDHFRLARSNPIIQSGLSRFDDAGKVAVTQAFDPQNRGSLPIIPLCGTAVAEVPESLRATISQARVGHILNWIVDRLHAVSKPVLESAIGPGFEGWAARSAVDTLISTWGKSKLKEVLQRELKGVIAD
jgi:predicted acylesterase/phospholipase RssA